MRSVVVGVRDRHSVATLVWAADIAAAHEASVVAVHAYVPAPPVPELGGAVDDRPWLEDLLDREWCRPLRVRGVPYRAEVLAGSVAAVLRRVALRDEASLLVVGRGRTTRRWRPRSTARHLTDSAPCPVAVVPGLGEAVPTWLLPSVRTPGSPRARTA